MGSELAPSFVPLDRRVEAAVDEMVQLVLIKFSELAKHAREASHKDEDDEDEGDTQPDDLPSLTADAMYSWLTKSCAPIPGTNPSFGAYVESVISEHVAALVKATRELDSALESVLSPQKYTIFRDRLIVDSPFVLDALEAAPLGECEVAFIPIKDVYEIDDSDRPMAFKGDERLDIVIAASRWRGVYLCRPALVCLDDVMPNLVDRHVTERAAPPRPNVTYNARTRH